MNNYLHYRLVKLALAFIVTTGFFISISETCFAQSSQAGGSGPYNYKTYKKAAVSNYSIAPVPSVTYFGIIPKALKTPYPLELINPFASRSYGYGRDMTSWNAREGKPKGFILAGIRFW